MTVTVKHSKTNAISDWTQAQLDEQIALGNFAPGTTLAQIVLPSDWNNDHTLTGVGTMAEQNANSVAITGGTINNTSIGATTASTGKFTSVTTPSVTASSLDLAFNTLTTGKININDGQATGALSSPLKIVYPNQYSGTAGSVNKLDLYSNQYGLGLSVSGGTASLDLIAAGTANTQVAMYTGNGVSTKQMAVTNTASAVNYVQVTGGATGNNGVISAQGSDSSVGLTFSAKNAGSILFQAAGGTNFETRYTATTPINYLSATGSLTTIAPTLSSRGNDTNIAMGLISKGTGAIDLAAGSSGVNISNGGTVTAITRTAAGAGYTSLPTMTISAPTTAGGVQATATYTMGLAGVPTITSGGTGYTVGDVLTFVGGTGGASTLTVSTVSAGVITGVTIGSFGLYTALPTNPISVTGGTGSSATFTATWAINSVFTITNAGSGYIEQPTVTFSGGGGSGASAIAKIGTGTTFKSLGGTASFNTYAGEGLRINNDGFATLTDYVEVQGGSSVAGAYIGVNGSTATASLYVSGKGGGTVDFFTNGQGNTRQARVSHTASAVNYVQVTGAATTLAPVISAQGSDTNIPLAINAKGTSAIRLGFNNTDYLAINTATAGTNYIQSLGGSTNIDIGFIPKGTGVLSFGTYTASVLTPTGYITIKDSGGTTRRLLVG